MMITDRSPRSCGIKGCNEEANYHSRILINGEPVQVCNRHFRAYHTVNARDVLKVISDFTKAAEILNGKASPEIA